MKERKKTLPRTVFIYYCNLVFPKGGNNEGKK